MRERISKSLSGRDLVPLILAIGVATALNCITFAVLYDAIFSDVSGLSENATQIITGAFGGILGVLGSYMGFKVAADHPPTDSSVDQTGTSAVPSPETPEAPSTTALKAPSRE